MKFNFTCWALCRVDKEEDDICFPDGMSAHLLDFWRSRDECETAAKEKELSCLRSYEKEKAEYEKAFPFQFYEYVPGRYIFVPLSQMEFDELEGAAEMIEKAALLMARGCGVTDGV